METANNVRQCVCLSVSVCRGGGGRWEVDGECDCIFLSPVPSGGDMVGIVIPLSFPTLHGRLQTCHSGGAENRPANQSRTHYQSSTWKGCIWPVPC